MNFYRAFMFIPLLIVLAASVRAEPEQTNREHFQALGYIILTGEQDGEYMAGRYVALTDIVVRPGYTLTLLPGVEFYFANESALQVHGRLNASGSGALPVTFAPLQRIDYPDPMPANTPYWSGIKATANAGLILRNTTITGCPTAISTVADNPAVVLDNVTLSNITTVPIQTATGQVDLPQGQPVRYPPADSLDATPPPQRHEKKPAPSLGAIPRRTRQRIVLGTATAACGATALIAILASRSYDARSETETDPVLAQSLWNSGTNAYTTAQIFGSLTAATGIGFGLTFIIPGKKR